MGVGIRRLLRRFHFSKALYVVASSNGYLTFGVYYHLTLGA
jgi:hypothetical protein